MPCCGQPLNGYQTVWQLRVKGEPQPREYADQATAQKEQAKVGGTVLRVMKKAG
jgi:hypothetical protein